MRPILRLGSVFVMWRSQMLLLTLKPRPLCARLVQYPRFCPSRCGLLRGDLQLRLFDKRPQGRQRRRSTPVSSRVLAEGSERTTINLNVNVHLYALAPVFMWVPKKKILGAKYGIMLIPSFASVSLSGLLSRAGKGAWRECHGRTVQCWGYVCVAGLAGLDREALRPPVADYGFYIPTGKYNIATLNVPVVGPVRQRLGPR